MSEINYLSEVRPNPGNDGEKPQTCSICGALLVCLSCGNHRDEAMDQARARIAELDERQEDYQGRLWCALGEAVKQMRARINEAEKLLSEGYLGLAEYIYEPVAVLPPDGSMDSPWMKRVRDFLDRDLKPAESPTDNRRNM